MTFDFGQTYVYCTLIDDEAFDGTRKGVSRMEVEMGTVASGFGKRN